MVAQEVPQWHDKYEAAQHPTTETLAKILREMAAAVKEDRDIDPAQNESLRKAFAELARKPN
ncbi:MAG TPA: hypothetical protein VHA06_08985 [Candidatus Angelobacter sp.]|nr:hypothetical protein [Candidatus Angelobacter sp.]